MAAHHSLGDRRWRSPYIFVHPPSRFYLLTSKPLILDHRCPSLSLSLPPPRWLPFLGQHAPSHLLPYFSLLIALAAVVPFG